ncbi:hypothetical protein PG985_002301 [Apiospora marii]|uniref:uncharacterized protein n=1 Tax=Apiospora marii TaxID=335849 RepID=UPI00312D9755
MMSTAQFRNFSNLPAEVRKRIWVFASIQPHTHVIIWYPSNESISRQYSLFWPGVLGTQTRRCEYGLLLANKESSEVVRQINKDTKPVSNLVHNLDLFISWELDLLYVVGSMYALDPLDLLSELPCSSRIRNLALSIVGHTRPYDLDLFRWARLRPNYAVDPDIREQAAAEYNKYKTALSRMTGLRTLKLVATAVFGSPFDPTPHHLKSALPRQVVSQAGSWTALDASPVGYNRRELRALAARLARDAHGFTNFRLISPSLKYGIRLLFDTQQFADGAEMNDYCRQLCDLIHHIRYKECHAAWGTLDVGLAVDLDSNFNRGDFPDGYRRVGMRPSSSEWHMAPDRFADRD